MIAQRQRTRHIVTIGIILAVGIGTGCSGGSSSGSAGRVIAVSFQGFPDMPGGNLPAIPRDETIRLTLSGRIDAGAFGGLYTAPGDTSPTVFEGHTATGTGLAPYFAFADQGAARASLQLFDDVTGVPFFNYRVGRLTTNDRLLILDPRIDQTDDPFGLTFATGFPANSRFTILIPAQNDVVVGGESIDGYGAMPPVGIPSFSSMPGPSVVFQVGTSLSPDFTAPTVLEITTVGLDAGADPGSGTLSEIAADDAILVRFSEGVDLTSIDPLDNLVVQNVTLGSIVPTAVTQSIAGDEVILTPLPAYGPGPFLIRVDVGMGIVPITDDASESPGGPNSLIFQYTRSFMTTAAPTTAQPTVLIEDFDSDVNNDTSFENDFSPALWDVMNSGRLEGIPLSGSPTGGTLGSRVQYTFIPPILLNAYFSPFDDNGMNNLGGNSNGGSRTQLLYQQDDGFHFPVGLSDTIELVEWAPTTTAGPVAAGHTYNGFSMKMGHTTASTSATSPSALTVIYGANFDMDNPQNEMLMPTSHPFGLPVNESPITVVAPVPYSVPQGAGPFVPFPLLQFPFDFTSKMHRSEIAVASGMSRTANLCLDLDIPPTVTPSGNFLIGGAGLTTFPISRIIGASGALIASTGDRVSYQMRFTFASRKASARTDFYDTGRVSPDYTLFNLSPPPSFFSSNASVVVRVEGADSIPNPANPVEAVLYDAAGNFNPAALDILDGSRYLRLIFDIGSDLGTNEVPHVERFMFGIAD